MVFDETVAMVINVLTNGYLWVVHSTIFLIIKLFLAVYSAVLIVDVALLIYLGNVRNQLRNMRTGTSAMKTSKSSDVREWRAITKRLESNEPEQLLAAILEADRFVFAALDTQGYSGATFAERLNQIPMGSFTSLDIVRDVHALSNKIIQNPQLRVTQAQAQNAIDVYQRFLEDIDVL